MLNTIEVHFLFIPWYGGGVLVRQPATRDPAPSIWRLLPPLQPGVPRAQPQGVRTAGKHSFLPRCNQDFFHSLALWERVSVTKMYRIFFWVIKNVLELHIGMVAQHCEYTKCHWVTHFKVLTLCYVNCISIKKKNVSGPGNGGPSCCSVVTTAHSSRGS